MKKIKKISLFFALCVSLGMIMQLEGSKRRKWYETNKWFLSNKRMRYLKEKKGRTGQKAYGYIRALEEKIDELTDKNQELKTKINQLDKKLREQEDYELRMLKNEVEKKRLLLLNEELEKKIELRKKEKEEEQKEKKTKEPEIAN